MVSAVDIVVARSVKELKKCVSEVNAKHQINCHTCDDD